MKGIFLLLGSNQGDKFQILKQAAQLISIQVGPIIKSSSVYTTKAWGIEDQPDFLNQVLEVESDLQPLEILKHILQIEEKLGRKRDIRWSSRIIDIDILYYSDEIIDLPDLHVPHPEIQNRNFTLAPLCDIAPDFIHPKLLKTQRELLDSCPDTLGVRKFNS